jgi:hypothetical protein
LLLDAPATGPSIYVATTGDDATGDGSMAAPLRSIAAAAARVGDGDTILVRPGLYTDPFLLSSTHATPVTLRSEVPYLARLEDPNPPSPANRGPARSSTKRRRSSTERM